MRKIQIKFCSFVSFLLCHFSCDLKCDVLIKMYKEKKSVIYFKGINYIKLFTTKFHKTIKFFGHKIFHVHFFFLNLAL